MDHDEEDATRVRRVRRSHDGRLRFRFFSEVEVEVDEEKRVIVSLFEQGGGFRAAKDSLARSLVPP